jgi:hypothetical protein
MSALFWPAFVISSWIVLYLAFIRPMLAKIHSTMGTAPTLASPHVSWGNKALTYIQGSKTVLLSFFVSLFTAGKSAVDALSQNTSILDEAKNNLPWSTFLTPDMALKAVGVIMFLITGLHLWGVLAAARSTPKA